MKTSHFLLLLAVITTVSACKQVNITPDKAVGPSVKTIKNALLIGKWTLVNDSTSGTGIGPKFTFYTNNYIGTGDDYFDFRADGNVYIKENGSLDTMTYSMASDTTVIFGKSGGYQVSASGAWMPVPTPPNVINPFTAHSASITYVSGVNPGGSGGSRIVNLKK
jgi:hypothetical protein